MRHVRLARCLSAARSGLGLALLMALVLAGCHKQTSAAPPPAKQTTRSLAKGAAAQPSTGQASAPGNQDSEDSDEAGGAPDLPDSVDGQPAMMSEDAFLSAYRQIDGVVVLGDGLMYRVISSGPAAGKSPKPTDKVRVVFKGTLMNGQVFEETAAGQTSEIDLSNAIAGWREALPLMKEGDDWEVVMPSNLAYGEVGRQGVAPNSPLVFDIRLLEVVSG